MAGGAGFIFSAINSLKDNKNLRKIRPNATFSDSTTRDKNLAKADLKSIDEGIKFRMNRYFSYHKSGYFPIAVFVLVICWIIWSVFF